MLQRRPIPEPHNIGRYCPGGRVKIERPKEWTTTKPEYYFPVLIWLLEGADRFRARFAGKRETSLSHEAMVKDRVRINLRYLMASKSWFHVTPE